MTNGFFSFIILDNNSTLTKVSFSSGSAAGILRSARGRRPGRSNHRATRPKTRAAAALGAVAVVGRARRVRSVHAVRGAVQRVQRARGRAALHAARPAARRRRVLTRAPHRPRLGFDLYSTLSFYASFLVTLDTQNFVKNDSGAQIQYQILSCCISTPESAYKRLCIFGDTHCILV